MKKHKKILKNKISKKLNFISIALVGLLFISIFITIFATQTQTPVRPKAVNIQSEDQKYIVLNKIVKPGGSCCIWWPVPATSIKGDAIKEITEKVGAKGGSKVRLAVGYTISYLNLSDSQEDQILNQLFKVATEEDIPIQIKLDGFSWWETRSDLWNWWDPSKNGYNPENKKNVEWTTWSENSAIKLAWRNWGSQIRVNPHPNLASPVLLKEKQTSLKRMGKKIAEWYDSLPEDKKYLFVGVVLDNELSIGVNFFHYPNGNSLLAKEDKDDPKYGLNLAKGISGGVQQIGYAAVSTFGIKTNGTIDANDIRKAVNMYSNIIAKSVNESGIPRNKIFVHGLGKTKDNNPGSGYDDIFTQYSSPGWSFYDFAHNPSLAPTLDQVLTAGNNPRWAAVEWLTGGNWKESIKNTLNYKNNAFLTIYNWEGGVINNQTALKAIKDVLLEMNAETTLTIPTITEKATPTGYIKYFYRKPSPVIKSRIPRIERFK